MNDLSIIQAVAQDDPRLATTRDWLLDLSTRVPSIQSYNVGAWKSNIDLLVRRDNGRLHDAQTFLREIAVPYFGKSTPIAWAMINRRGSFHRRHSHGLLGKCVVFYVTSGDPPIPTIFEVPTDGRIVEHAVSPTPGSLALFNGKLHHYVPVYNGDEPRITVAMELP